MSTSYGKNIRVTVYGGSHDDHIGIYATGLPKDFSFDPAALSADMAALSSHSDKGRSGLLVGQISPGGLLDMLELQQGDLLLRASNKRIARLNDLAELAAELNASPPKPLELEIMRGGTITLIRYRLD